MTANFRAVRFHRLGDPVDMLAVEEIAAAPPGEDEVVIRVEAFALNRADWLYCRGEYYSLPDLPSRIGSAARDRFRREGRPCRHKPAHRQPVRL